MGITKAIGSGLLAITAAILANACLASSPERSSNIPAIVRGGFVLDVDHIIQPKGSTWCWAAVGEAIMTFHGHDIPKEEQVADLARCPLGEGVRAGSNSEFDDDHGVGGSGLNQHLAGWPQFERYDFHVATSETPLTFQAIAEEIIGHNRPLAYAYTHRGRMGHIVTIIGVKQDARGKEWLVALDSQQAEGPVKVSYKSYAKRFGYDRHLRTYHQIFPLK